MDLPCRYAYNPQWRFALFGVALGAVLVVVRIHWIISAVGILFAFFGSMLAIRRLVFPRFLEIEQDRFLIPGGFLRTQSKIISYADIEETWETLHGSSTATLHLRIKGIMYEIPSMMLPDMVSYKAAKDFINSRVTPKINHDKPIEAGKYCFNCSYEGNGEVYNSNGEIVWRVKTLHDHPHYPYGFFRLPDFVVYDKADNEVFRIKRERKWFLAQFVMLENGLPTCTIRLRSVLRTKYSLNFASGQEWAFRMPLFTVYFTGLSKTGDKIRVRLWSHNIWYSLIDPNVDSPQLVVALAFIHRERLRFG